MFNDIFEFSIAEAFIWVFFSIWNCLLILYFQQVESKCNPMNLMLFISTLRFFSIMFFKANKNSTSDIVDLDMIKVLILVFWSFVPVAIYTFCGDAVSNQFELFNDELCQSKWYLFPIELQQILPIVVANVQQPTTVRGFGNTFCTREAFKKVDWRNCSMLGQIEKH